ncbi:MAG: cysteine hydrolase family protein [Betaproteobacteria bacterium]
MAVNASPRPFAFDSERTALLVIDVQNDFCSPGGYMEHAGVDVSNLRKPVEPIQRLLKEARRVGMYVIFTREGHRPGLQTVPASFMERTQFAGHPIGRRGPLGRLLVRGERGHEIIEELKPLPNETIIDKPGKGAFYATPLESVLRSLGATHLAIAGVTTEVCVQTTMREANDRGYDCLLVEDATESYFPEFKRATLAMVRAQGAIVGWTATTSQVVEALCVENSDRLTSR